MNTALHPSNLKLNTSVQTLIMRINDNDIPDLSQVDVTEYIPQPNISILKSPVIISAIVSVSYFCRNAKCSMGFEPEQTSFPRCPHCNFKTAFPNLTKQKEVTIVTSIDGKDHFLAIPENVLDTIPSIKDMASDDDVENYLLSLNDVNISYDCDKNVVTCIEHIG